MQDSTGLVELLPKIHIHMTQHVRCSHDTACRHLKLEDLMDTAYKAVAKMQLKDLLTMIILSLPKKFLFPQPLGIVESCTDSGCFPASALS
jgi:hypothetical protein